jgi:hypothetical protein
MADAFSVTSKPPPPSRSQKILAGVFIVGTVAAIYGLQFSPFLPTPLGERLALVAGCASAALIALAALVGPYSLANPNIAAQAAKRWFLRFTPVRVLLFAGFFFFIAYGAVGGALESIWTALTGPEKVQAATIVGWHTRSRYSCNAFEVAGSGWLGNHALCADSAYAAEAIRGRRIFLTGRASPLGINVERFRLGPAPPRNERGT